MTRAGLTGKRGGTVAIAVVSLFLAFAVWAIVQALPGGDVLRRHPLHLPLMWGVMGLCGVMTVVGLWKRQWLHTLFCLGLLGIVIGGGISAGYAQEGTVTFAETLSPYIDPWMVRQRVIGGEKVTFRAFEIAYYPETETPKQYTTRLLFPDGEEAEVAVNKPYRRNGFTYYQMSYDLTPDPMGMPCTRTQLLVRRDPGVPVVFAGFGCLLVAAAWLMCREVCQGVRV